MTVLSDTGEKVAAALQKVPGAAEVEVEQTAACRFSLSTWTAPNWCLLMAFVLLFIMFNNAKDGLLVFTRIPFALSRGVLSLWLRAIPPSITAAVGFTVLSHRAG